MSIFFKDGGFYLDQFNDSIPVGAVEITQETYDAMFAGQAAGQMIVTAADGAPALLDKPAPTHEELVAIAEQTKQGLIAVATNRISVLQDAVDLDMATDAETAALPLWKKYRVLLSRVDANTSDDVFWPEAPDF